jgi:hypothetical protein
MAGLPATKDCSRQNLGLHQITLPVASWWTISSRSTLNWLISRSFTLMRPSRYKVLGTKEFGVLDPYGNLVTFVANSPSVDFSFADT